MSTIDCGPAPDTLVLPKPTAAPSPDLPTPMHLMEIAINKGVDADTLGKLMELQFKWDANQQRAAYINAMHEFRSNPPEINKTKKVSYENKDRSVTTYYHAELDDVVEIISQSLRKVDIRPSWKTSDQNGKITVTCVLTHKLGHSEEVATLAGPADTSGGKNNIQAIGSTTTYLQRYTLLAGTGLAAKGQDDDGRTEGMDSGAIDEYCAQMRDSLTVADLMNSFKECHGKAKNLNDKIAMGTFINVYNEKKKALR